MQSMVIDERECRKKTVAEVARQIMIAGRTAPKGKGIDLIEIVAVTGETIEALAEATRLASEQTGMKFFLRDAENIRQADAVILVGTRLQSLSLNCGYCGYPTCEKKNGHPAAPCALNMVDLGIAIGSMTAKAADLRVDNRVMFSAGKAAPSIGLLAGCHSIYAIPLSVSSKNPFFGPGIHPLNPTAMYDIELKNELERRWSSVREELARQQANALLVTTNVNLYYVSGRVFAGMAYIPNEGEPLFFVRRPVGLKGENVLYIRKPEEMSDRLRERGISLPRKLLLETDSIPMSEYLRYEKIFSPEQTGNGTRLLRTVRSVKTPFELGGSGCRAGSMPRSTEEFPNCSGPA